MVTSNTAPLGQAVPVKKSKRQIDMEKLQSLLAAIPGVNPALIAPAIDSLMEAAEGYQASKPIVDAQGRRSKPGIAEARSSIAALHKSLAAVQAQLAVLPLNAFTELTNAYDAPMGQLKADVAQVFHATAAALKSLKAQPDKAPDIARHIVACEVAKVFRDILQVKPTATRDDAENVTGARGGAAYAIVLRATYAIAGLTQIKLGPLIDVGLALLADPDLPHNLS